MLDNLTKNDRLFDNTKILPTKHVGIYLHTFANFLQRQNMFHH